MAKKQSKAPRIQPKVVWTVFTLLCVGFLVSVGAYAFLRPSPTDQTVERAFTHDDCIAAYGVINPETSECLTPDGRTYFKFKSKTATYDECVRDGGKVQQDSCVVEGRFIPKFPDQVSTYNECQRGYPRHIVNSVPEPYICVDKNGLAFYAGGQKDRQVNSYEECVKAGGPIGKSYPRKCYYDLVVYWQTLKPAHKYLNVPHELKEFGDCAGSTFAISIKMREDKIVCRAFNGQDYIYDGPKIENFEDCARVMRFVLESNPPQCYGPDGTRYIGT